jgi:hypothetical protein
MVDNMIGLGRPVLVRTKHELFGAVISGAWVDTSNGLGGPIVKLPSNETINVDWKRIVRYADNDEIPWQKLEEL